MVKKVATATVVKNVGYRLAEWIAFQKAVGFDAVLLRDNGSTDNTVEIAKAFAGYYDVRIEDWPETGPEYQMNGYDNMLAAAKGEFDWVACIDCDEFLVMPEPKTLQDLVDVPDDVSGISMSWAFFGSSGHIETPKDLVIKSFLNRANDGFGPSQQVKSIIRPERAPKCVNVHVYAMEGHYVDMIGRVHSGHSHMPPLNPDFSGGKLHHYFTQSQQDWQEKISRGYHDTVRKLEEFHGYDRNETFDDSALRYAPEVERILTTVFGSSGVRRTA